MNIVIKILESKWLREKKNKILEYNCNNEIEGSSGELVTREVLIYFIFYKKSII